MSTTGYKVNFIVPLAGGIPFMILTLLSGIRLDQVSYGSLSGIGIIALFILESIYFVITLVSLISFAALQGRGNRLLFPAIWSGISLGYCAFFGYFLQQEFRNPGAWIFTLALFIPQLYVLIASILLSGKNLQN